MKLIMVALCFLGVAAFLPRTTRDHLARTSTRVSALPLLDFSSLLTALEEAKPDDYVYGAVAAPPLVPILGAVVVILLAGVPILLAPGEKALEEQRANEAAKKTPFNSRKDKDLR